ncbi:hypothetical protein BD626DRAFT_636121 [Schizophyllum amplum]|uniref:Uncharacterized protein n=1 Tax=Schizophyllum amplum TaxID=97359 RepID=A0A550BTU7_9AGAR|nr:hypothetical protein BD626DRAFT_636121 [Auriculariopsis ampla]
MSPKSHAPWNLFLAYMDDLHVALILIPHAPTPDSTAYRWQINCDPSSRSHWQKHFEKGPGAHMARDLRRLRFVAQVPADKHALLYNTIVKDIGVANAYNYARADYGPRIWAVDALDGLVRAGVIAIYGTERQTREQVLCSIVDEGFDACRRQGRDVSPLISQQREVDTNREQSAPAERSRSPFRAFQNAIRSRTARSFIDSHRPRTRDEGGGYSCN